MRVRVFGTPAGLEMAMLAEATAIVIDALRMTSVAATAKENGCTGLRAVAGVDEARAIAAQADALLGGERMALPIESFDFSNSPLEYTRERVEGRRIVMTTSNGTKAILAADGAKRLLLGAFVNVSAVAEAVAGDADVAIVCAGTQGAFTLEDALAAGAVVSRLRGKRLTLQLDDMAIAAERLYREARGDLWAALAGTAHYGRLKSLGLSGDLAYCLSEDRVRAVPERRGDGWFV